MHCVKAALRGIFLKPFQFVAQGNDFADNDKRGARGVFCQLGQVFQTTRHDALVRKRAVGDDGDGCVAAASVRHQFFGGFGGFERAHIDDQGLVVEGERAPVGLVAVVFAVSGHEERALGAVAVCQGDACVGGRAQCGGDAGDDAVRDVCLPQNLGFFAAAPENEGVAAFEPDDAQTLAGVFDQEAVGFFLLDVVRACAFADADFVRVFAHHA